MPPRPSQLRIRNQLAFAAGETVMEVSRKTGPQKERLTNDAIAAWSRLHPELVIGRNKRRLATPPGMSAPIMLGLLLDGSSDWIGYRSVVVTPAMVGQRLAQFVALEAKTETGVASAEQKAFISAVNHAGGVAGVVRSADDAEELLR